MSYPGRFSCGFPTPQRLRHFVLPKEGMVAGGRPRLPPATIPSFTGEPLGGEQCRPRLPQNISG
ncbi:hypothetical protein [Reticulibacter mediterranei]|uniref:hypothetical protein n=1 Tax=Reticulibacter mediterranei TaxID=2778369 RepID=UPI001C68A364|nr:hypothetical protein [Reticulibacter mediterranei]